jgi:hypothetical protein
MDPSRLQLIAIGEHDSASDFAAAVRTGLARNPNQSYCRAIVAPKVAKARSHFIGKLKK